MTTAPDHSAPAATVTLRLPHIASSVPLSFAAVLVCFFFSFVNVTCQGQRVATFSGVQLAMGTDLKSKDMFGQETVKKVPREPLALLALLAGGGGLLLSFGRRSTKILTTSAGGLGAGLLLLLKNKVDHDALRNGGMFQLDWGIGFYVAIILFLVAAVLNSGVVEHVLNARAKIAVIPPGP